MKARTVTYWTTTILVAFFMSGGIAQVLRLPPTIDGFHRVLGYPVYFVVILGVWKILGAIAILIPRFSRLKEWAYAGIFFDLTGAAVSNASVGGYGAYAFHIIAPLAIAVLAVISWVLRPPQPHSRRPVSSKIRSRMLGYTRTFVSAIRCGERRRAH